jgi:hypothetical protein
MGQPDRKSVAVLIAAMARIFTNALRKNLQIGRADRIPSQGFAQIIVSSLKSHLHFELWSDACAIAYWARPDDHGIRDKCDHRRKTKA